MTKKQITPAEAAAVIGQRGGQSKSDIKREAAKVNAQSAGRTPKGYDIYKSDADDDADRQWIVDYIGDGKRTTVGDTMGYEHRREAMQAARDDKARRAHSAEAEATEE